MIAAVSTLAACSGGDDAGEPEAAPTTTVLADTTTSTSTSTTTTVPAPPALAWSTEIDGGHDRVVVGPAQVFVLGDQGRVRALDRDRGGLLWDKPRQRSIAWSASAVDSDLVLYEVAGATATVTRLDGATGEARWVAQVGAGGGPELVGDPGSEELAVLTAPMGASFRTLDLANGALSNAVPGQPRAVGPERVVSVTDNSTLNFYDLATLAPVAAPIELGSSFGLDALDMSGLDLLMVNGQELKLIDAGGTSLATGRVTRGPGTIVQALGDGRVLVSGFGGSQLFERDGTGFDSLWHSDGITLVPRGTDARYLVVAQGATVDVVDTSVDEPVSIGSIPLGGTPFVEANGRVVGGRLYLSAGGEHAAYDLASGVVKVWSVPAAASDVLTPFDDGVLRVTTVGGKTVVELYR